MNHTHFTTYKLYPKEAYLNPNLHFSAKRGPHGEIVEDEHYAERIFVEKIFVPTFGLAALTYLRPQVPFGKIGQRIDFVLEGTKKYAIEIEGAAYHSFHDKEKVRIQDLVEHGYSYFPITYQSIQNGKAQEELNKLKTDPRIKQITKQALPTYSPNTQTYTIQVEALLKGFTERYQKYQQLVLTILWDAVQGGKECIILADFQPRFPIFAIALNDMVVLLEKVADLYGLSLTLPEIKFYVIGNPGDSYQQLFELYQQAGPHINGKNSDDTTYAIFWYYETKNPTLDFTYFSQAERQRHPVIKDAKSFDAIGKYVAKFLTHVGTKFPVRTTLTDPRRSTLDYFARRYFKVPELKHEQLLLLQRSLLGESSIGILPTGFGKSLIYQLYAILVPHTILVISPLKALMRDQLYHLHKIGFKAAEMTTSDDSAAEKDAKLRDFLEHKYRLFYISPERLLVKEFQQKLRDAAINVPIGALVIDEAHCVSEWGHDFRPAYLQIGYFRRQLEAAVSREIVTFGLTATASVIVRKDIISLLELSEEAIIQMSRVDRPNLSFSVHPVADAITAKTDMLETVFCETLPQALKLDDWHELLPIGEEPPFEHAGVVFAIYADPHGRKMLEEGAPAIAHRITEHIVPDQSLVKFHASKPPTRCPKCKSVLYHTRMTHSKDDKVCYCLNHECKHQFPHKQVFVTPNWDQEIIHQQELFQANQFPLLVATKGFGMGIDKRNIRYVIHHALAGSMEGYFQEAGRAGRDGKHAHIALIYKPPTEACYANHLSKNQAPPCVTIKENKQFQKCPYGLKQLCDAGRQAFFISNSYPGEEQDKLQLQKTYTDIMLNKGLLWTAKADGADEGDGSSIQVYLYRLQQLGIIQNYNLEFLQNGKIRFEVAIQLWDLHTLETNLSAFLRKMRSSESAINTAMARLRRVHQTRSLNDHQVSPVLEIAIDILLERIYAEIPKIRYTRLGNLLRYTTSDQRKACRRIEIRSTFDDEELALENYHCGFCDVCQPDLNFQVDMAEVPLRDAEIQQASRQLPQILEVFDVEQLPQLVQVAVDKGAVPGLYAKVSSALERDATNLSALYLAGALGIRQEQFIDLGFEQLCFCYQEGKRQGLHLAGIQLIYVEAKSIRPIEAFIWINEVNGPFDNQEGLLFLAQEATQLFGTTSHLTHNLHHLHHIRVLQQMQKKITHLSASLSALLEDFSSFPCLKGKN